MVKNKIMISKNTTIEDIENKNILCPFCNDTFEIYSDDGEAYCNSCCPVYEENGDEIIPDPCYSYSLHFDSYGYFDYLFFDIKFMKNNSEIELFIIIDKMEKISIEAMGNENPYTIVKLPYDDKYFQDFPELNYLKNKIGNTMIFV